MVIKKFDCEYCWEADLGCDKKDELIDTYKKLKDEYGGLNDGVLYVDCNEYSPKY